MGSLEQRSAYCSLPCSRGTRCAAPPSLSREPELETGVVTATGGARMNVLINASTWTPGATPRAWQNLRAKCAPGAAIPLRLIVGYGFLAHGLEKWHRGPEAF